MIRQVLTALGLLVAAGGTAEAADRAVARGRYLVEGIGMCGDCHTPRGPTGEPVVDQALMGAPIGFKPLVEMPWAATAPRLAGLPEGYTATQLVTFLTTGQTAGGKPPRPPMPPYRFNKADAAAVAAYLKSLR